MCGGGVKEAQSEGLSLYSAHPHTHKCKYTHTHMHRQFRLNWTTTEFCKHYRPHPHLYTSTHPEQKGFKCCHTHHRVPECVRRPPRNRGRIKKTSVTSSPAADFVIPLGCCKQRRTEHQTGCSVSVCVFVWPKWSRGDEILVDTSQWIKIGWRESRPVRLEPEEERGARECACERRGRGGRRLVLWRRAQPASRGTRTAHQCPVLPTVSTSQLLFLMIARSKRKNIK